MSERDSVDQLLELAVTGLAPSADDKERHRAALGRWLAPDRVGTSVRELGPSGPARSWSALRASGAAGWTTGVLLLGAGVGLGFWLRAAIDERAPLRLQPAAPRAAAFAATPDGVAPPSSTPVPPAQRSDALSVSERAPQDAALAGPTTRIEPRRLSVAAKPARLASRRRDPSDGAPSGVEPVLPRPFDEELALLQRVERALRAKSASVAVALLDELDERFPETRLGEERQAARHVAECQLELPESLSRAQRFLAKRGGSVYAHRVRAACVPEVGDDFSAPEKAPAPADTPGR